MPGFDVEAARKSGYGDDEILQHLTQSRKFDIDGALKSGYTKPEIIAHLSTTPPRATAGEGASALPFTAGKAIVETVSDQIRGEQQNFLQGLVPDTLSALGGAAKRVVSGPQNMQDAALTAVAGPLGPLAGDMVGGAVGKLGEAFQQARTGNIGSALGKAAEIIPGVEAARSGEVSRGLGQATGMALAPKAMPKMARVAGGAGELAGAGWNKLRGTPPNFQMAMTQGLKPKATNLQFPSALRRAGPEIKAAEADLGRPIQTIDDLVGTPEAPGAIQLAKRNVRAQYDAIAGPQREMGTTVDMKPVADAMVKTIGKKMLLEEPEKAAAIMERAKSYRRQVPLETAEEILKTTNAELDAYHAKYPTAQRSEVASNPETALLNAQAISLRDSIYTTLDNPAQGYAARELQKRYGSLMNVEREAYRRRNVAMRQQPSSLSEQIGTWSGIGDIVRGTGSVLTGNPAGALSIAEGFAKRKAAKWIKEQQTTNALIKKAFASFTEKPVPVQAPPAPRIAGLLEPAPIRMGPIPDESGIVPGGGPVPGMGMPMPEGSPVPVQGRIAEPPAPPSTPTLRQAAAAKTASRKAKLTPKPTPKTIKLWRGVGPKAEGSAPGLMWATASKEYAMEYGKPERVSVPANKVLDLRKETTPGKPGWDVHKSMDVGEWVDLFRSKGIDAKVLDESYRYEPSRLWDLLDGRDVDLTKTTNLVDAMKASEFDLLVVKEPQGYSGTPVDAYAVIGKSPKPAPTEARHVPKGAIEGGQR